MIVFKDLPWYYAEMLDWKIENGVVKAFPKHPLGDTAFKMISEAFRKWGGKFVFHNGVAYFEFVLEPRRVSIPIAVDIKRAYEKLQKEG